MENALPKGDKVCFLINSSIYSNNVEPSVVFQHECCTCSPRGCPLIIETNANNGWGQVMMSVQVSSDHRRTQITQTSVL